MGQGDQEALSAREVKLFLGVKFVTESCTLLRLSFQVRYKALVLLYSFSEEIGLESLCTACVLLAAKLEEEVCTLKRVIYVFNYLYTGYESKPGPLTSRLSIRLKEGCVVAETQILRSLGFDAAFEDVYGDLVDFLQAQSLSPDAAAKIFQAFNTLIHWPEVKDMDSGALVVAAIESCFGTNKRFESFLEKYKAFCRKKFDLQTYQEIHVAKGIDEGLLQGFAKRQRHR